MPVFKSFAKVSPGSKAVPSANRAVPPMLKVSVVVAAFAFSPPARVSVVDHCGADPDEVRTVFAAPMVSGVKALVPLP